MKDIEADFGKPLEMLLFEWYYTEDMTLEQIREELGDVSVATVGKWMTRLGLNIQTFGRNPGAQPLLALANKTGTAKR